MEVLNIHPVEVRLLMNDGEGYFNEGNLDQARGCFEKIIALDPQNWEALNNLGVIHFSEGAHQEALPFFHRALDHNGKYNEALENLEACLRNFSDFTIPAENLNFLKNLFEKSIGYLLDSGNLTAARDLLIPATKAIPGLQQLNVRLAQKEKLKRLPVAIVSASELLERDPVRKKRWGDYWFGRELAAALADEGVAIEPDEPKIVIHLHGVPINKIDRPTYNIIWIHSHPDLITAQALSMYDHIFSLSPRFLKKIEGWGKTGEALIGGTTKQPPLQPHKITHDLVFVANGKQGQGRKIVRDLLALGNRWIDRLEVWGEGWEAILPGKCIRGIYFENEKLADLYAYSRVVLNDHHEDMRREGFLNPRILDAMASGGVVLSDDLSGAEDLFGKALLTYKTLDDLNNKLIRLFQDEDYWEGTRAAGFSAAKAYSFKSVAKKIVRHLTAIDENRLETRWKNAYMQKVWAPVKGKLATQRIRRLKEVTAGQCEGRTLDIGCANGDSTAIMKKHNPSLTLFGLELTDWGCQEAKKNHRDMNFVQGEASGLPFTNRSFDTVVLDHVIEHVSDPVPLIMEAKRVARRRVVIGLPIMHLNDPDHKVAWRVDDFRNLLAGFFPEVSIRGMREPDGVEVPDPANWNFVVGTGYLEEKNRKEVPLERPLKLHLGCGQRRLADFLNIDIIASPAVDLQCDSRRLPLPAKSVSRIETYHMIEHLPRHDFYEALFEWNRVLEEGGSLVIECPDFEMTVKEYVEGKRFRINNIFGLQRHPGDFHLFGYGFNDLNAILESIGFREIRRKEPTDYHAVDEPSLRLEAVKVHEVKRPPDTRGLSIQQTGRNYAQALQAMRRAGPLDPASLIGKGPLKLDICGGEYPYGNGFLNVDIRRLPNVDIVSDISKRIDFPDRSVDEILSCGTLEQFYLPTVLNILKEMRRILKPGGKLTVGVPNLTSILAAFQRGQMDFQLFNQYIYGSVQGDNNPFNVHRSLWDAQRMIEAMNQADFKRVGEQPYDLPFHLPQFMLKVVGFA